MVERGAAQNYSRSDKEEENENGGKIDDDLLGEFIARVLILATAPGPIKVVSAAKLVGKNDPTFPSISSNDTS